MTMIDHIIELTQAADHWFVEIESASFDYSRDQNKIENKIPVVSVSDRGKQMGDRKSVV